MIIVFDLLLCLGLIWISISVLSSRNLFKSVILFIAFGLILSLSWVRLGAVDVALAEAAIGAGITGILLLDALDHFRDKKGKSGP